MREEMSYGDPLEWIIRNIASLEKAEGQAAAILREAYRRGLEGLEAPVLDGAALPGPALSSLSALADRAYSMGKEDAEGREDYGYNKGFVGGRDTCLGPVDHIPDTVAARQAWR